MTNTTDQLKAIFSTIRRAIDDEATADARDLCTLARVWLDSHDMPTDGAAKAWEKIDAIMQRL